MKERRPGDNAVCVCSRAERGRVWFRGSGMVGERSAGGQSFLQLCVLIWLLTAQSAEINTRPDSVECIYYNGEVLECTWSLADGNVNYTMYYWYTSEPAEECGSYIQQDGYNIGCKFTKDKIREFVNFHVHRIGINGSESVFPPNQTFQLQDQVKPNPPANLTVNAMANSSISLTWEAPMIPRCLQYEIKYRSNKDKDWQTEYCNEQTKFTLPSVNPDDLYVFCVRSKINDFCGLSHLWSKWSSHIYWGEIITEPEEKNFYFWILISILAVVVLLLIILCRLQNKRLQSIFRTSGPAPEQTIVPLIEKINQTNGTIKETQEVQ
eukprot:gi/632936085/ref/XP_007892317.1/ PREDICTED: cytokine receptor common subunit gamma-like isoform X3 [Callorhinchus milii]